MPSHVPLRSSFASLFASLTLLAACDLSAVNEGAPEQQQSALHPRPIIHGQPSTAKAHEAAVEMFYMGEGICTATLIADTVVLTAAHCVYVKDCQYNWETGESENCQLETDPARFDFRTGTSASDSARQMRRASAILAHPNYNDTYLLNDIALLRLASPFEGVAPIPALPDKAGIAWSADDVGQTITYVGFGLTESGASGRRLQVASTVDVVCLGPSHCGDGENWYAPPRAICSFMSAGGTCNGDSGGPALLVRDGVTYVAGVTSFGDENCEFYGCSTSVSAFASWIADYIGGELANGEGCIDDGQCVSGFCAQGVCCDQRCDATLCEACSAARGAVQDGVCTPLVACEGESDCKLAGTCDPATGACVHEPKPADTLCDDGNACTLDDHCLLGQCVGAGSVYCAPPGECQVATESSCQPMDGSCAYENLPDGTACGADGERTCRSGLCAASSSDGSGCAAAGKGTRGGTIMALLSLVGICLMEARKRT